MSRRSAGSPCEKLRRALIIHQPLLARRQTEFSPVGDPGSEHAGSFDFTGVRPLSLSHSLPLLFTHKHTHAQKLEVHSCNILPCTQTLADVTSVGKIEKKTRKMPSGEQRSLKARHHSRVRRRRRRGSKVPPNPRKTEPDRRCPKVCPSAHIAAVWKPHRLSRKAGVQERQHKGLNIGAPLLYFHIHL